MEREGRRKKEIRTGREREVRASQGQKNEGDKSLAQPNANRNT